MGVRLRRPLIDEGQPTERNRTVYIELIQLANCLETNLNYSSHQGSSREEEDDMPPKLTTGPVDLGQIADTADDVMAGPVQPAATQPVDADGVARGCRTPNTLKISWGFGSRDVGILLPSWTQATNGPVTPSAGPETVTGVLTNSKISGTDFPLKPWHTSYDWNLFVRPDPQYRRLLSTANVQDDHGILECEWESSCLPTWARPQQGQRIWMVGRWIYDCAHPLAHGYKTEIHPPKALASFRSEAVTFPGNAGPTQANQAVVFIGRDGGYFKTSINDQDYEFSFPMPPRPVGSQPRIMVTPKMGRWFIFSRKLPVNPKIDLSLWKHGGIVKVKVPLKGLQPHPDDYGMVISAGWSDPQRIETKQIHKVRVTVDKVFMDANLDPIGRDEWSLHVGINGRWKILHNQRGDVSSVNHSVLLDLHPDHRIRISVCGYEADTVDDLMGRQSGVSPNLVSASSPSNTAEDAAGKIRDAFVAGLGSGVPDENDPISTFFNESAPPTGPGKISSRAPSPGGDYRVEYTVERV